MAYSYNRYISNGVTTTFTSPPYLEAEHISVEVQGVALETSAYTLTGTVVNLHTTPLVSQEIIVRRSTSPSTRLVTFTSTYQDEDDLNRNEDHLLYLMQEALDARVGVAEYIDRLLIHISEPTSLRRSSYAVLCWKKKPRQSQNTCSE